MREQRLRWGLGLACLVAAGALVGSLSRRGHAGDGAGSHPQLPDHPARRASATFADVWYDGTAEISGYRAIVPRYGQLRNAELALVYVTEPLDRRTWIKDDDVPRDQRVDVLKLNVSLKFLAGVYPYSVMTSVFSPVDDWRGERFSPVKVSLTSQEWCGQVFQAVWPGRDRFQTEVRSYFASEGEATSEVATAENTLYEDALPIQLRELDGPFAGGGDWSGSLVPALWRIRRAHEPTHSSPATITRSTSGEGDARVSRFVVLCGDYRRTFDIETQPPHRVLGWTTSDGEDVHLIRSARLAYWKLNKEGDETHRADIGLTPAEAPPKITPPEGTTKIGR